MAKNTLNFDNFHSKNALFLTYYRNLAIYICSNVDANDKQQKFQMNTTILDFLEVAVQVACL